MSEPVLTAHDALKWSEMTANGWRRLLAAHPEILALPCDVAHTTTVAQLFQHIVAVELRYAERILGQPETDYSVIPYASAETIFDTHDRAMQLMHRALESNLDWDRTIAFTTRTRGPAAATLKTIFFHSVFHGIRHYAQLSTLARQNGYQIDWPGDYLLMGISIPKPNQTNPA